MDHAYLKDSALVDNGLLDKVDKLFACGVGNYIDLPQLIVVGDQSSGKSSVLEGLTKLPFPRASTLCTRFAAQVTFRRAEETRVTVTILSSQKSNDRIEEMRDYKRTAETLTGVMFENILAEVRGLMGIVDGPATESSCSFSDHTLKIEVSDPGEEHFSVIDVPGIFEKATPGTTTKRDIMLVKSMVTGHMENPRSVMLTVIPANTDIANQKILSMAEEVDPDGPRTLGVLTKPDLVDKGAEPQILELLEGKAHELTLGWYVVRNPGQQQLLDGVEDRASTERQFFDTEKPWSGVNKDRVGIEALRIRLKDICTAHIRREFPKVKLEIGKKLARARKDLQILGEKRQTPEDQKEYLLKLCMEFQKTTSLALSANYNGSDWFDNNPMLSYGHLYDFHQERPSRPGGPIPPRTEYVAAPQAPRSVSIVRGDYSVPELGQHFVDGANDCDSKSTGCQSSLEDFPDFSLIEAHPDLLDIVDYGESPYEVRNGSILEWLHKVYTTSRGQELGTFDGSLLASTMKEQSTNWEGFARGYMSDIISIVHSYLLKLLGLVCGSNVRTRDGLMSLLTERLLERYKAAMKHAIFLLNVERRGTPATLNHYFNDNLEISRQKRIRDRMQSQGARFETVENDWQKYMQAVENIRPPSMSNVDHIVGDIHDILKSYYKVALKRFVDNLHMQAANYYLISGPDTPLTMFEPTFINRLTETQLEDIAGEDASVKHKRKALEQEISALEEGRTILL